MEDVKFISYDGAYPNLCSGELVVEICGKRIDTIRLESTGSAYIYGDYGDYDEVIEEGDWEISTWNVPDEDLELVEKYADEITALVNANVPHGCCGGCI